MLVDARISAFKKDLPVLKKNWADYEQLLRVVFCMFGAIHKLRLQEEWGRWSKQLTFCELLYHIKCKRRGVGGQKKPILVNVVCERPLTGQGDQAHCLKFYKRY